jgi:hypothetical protein
MNQLTAFSRFKNLLFIFSLLLFLFSVSSVSAQDQNNVNEKTPKTEKPKNQKNSDKKQSAPVELSTAEQVAESAIFIYGGLLGRQNLNQIRKTTFERGKITITEADGQKNTANYDRFIIRGESLDKEKIRLDQSFPNARFSLVYSNDKVFGIYNDSVFTPREDAAKAFLSQIWHSIESLLRYKENESKLELAGREKIMGVDFYLLDLTDKKDRKTRFYVSVKTLRVMMLEYEMDKVKYRRRFYDYNYAQGTLVPYRSVLWADDKEVEVTEIGTITFGQKVEESLFQQ